jgi:hypothetical protein
MVFEVACFPSQGAITIDPGDFLIKAGTKSEFVHPADAATVASVMQEKNTPRIHPNGNTDIYTSGEVGYESGTDPYTGRRVHGVYTAAGAGVGHESGPMPPAPPPPGSTPDDRSLLESQLAGRAFPQGNFAAPVAGFLYFPARELKKKSSGDYELEYLSDGSGKVRLQVPAKTR